MLMPSEEPRPEALPAGGFSSGCSIILRNYLSVEQRSEKSAEPCQINGNIKRVHEPFCKGDE